MFSDSRGSSVRSMPVWAMTTTRSAPRRRSAVTCSVAASTMSRTRTLPARCWRSHSRICGGVTPTTPIFSAWAWPASSRISRSSITLGVKAWRRPSASITLAFR